jgi:hypothetical protein
MRIKINLLIHPVFLWAAAVQAFYSNAPVTTRPKIASSSKLYADTMARPQVSTPFSSNGSAGSSFPQQNMNSGGMQLASPKGSPSFGSSQGSSSFGGPSNGASSFGSPQQQSNGFGSSPQADGNFQGVSIHVTASEW